MLFELEKRVDFDKLFFLTGTIEKLEKKSHIRRTGPGRRSSSWCTFELGGRKIRYNDFLRAEEGEELLIIAEEQQQEVLARAYINLSTQYASGGLHTTGTLFLSVFLLIGLGIAVYGIDGILGGDYFSGLAGIALGILFLRIPLWGILAGRDREKIERMLRERKESMETDNRSLQGD